MSNLAGFPTSHEIDGSVPNNSGLGAYIERKPGVSGQMQAAAAPAAAPTVVVQVVQQGQTEPQPKLGGDFDFDDHTPI